MEAEKALYMIPVPISDGALSNYLPNKNLEIIKEIKFFIVENIRTARRFIKKVDPGIDISQLIFHELNRHTDPNEISGFLNPLRQGNAIGLMSEAGCPGIADPGSDVVALAQQIGLRVIPLVGPSSIIMSLMASGMNGQNFAFHGYLPIKENERANAIKELEVESRKKDMTQIFIETPYRNEKMMESLLKNLSQETMLCLAANVSNIQEEKIITRTVKKWKEENYKPEKVPTIFLFYRGK